MPVWKLERALRDARMMPLLAGRARESLEDVDTALRMAGERDVAALSRVLIRLGGNVEYIARAVPELRRDISEGVEDLIREISRRFAGLPPETEH